MMSVKSKTAAALTAVILAAMLVFDGCGGTVCRINSLNYIKDTSSSGAHTSDFSDAVQYETGETVFSFDKSTSDIAIMYGGRLWYALPTAENAVASMFTLTAIYGGKLYSLNSQDNSASLGGMSYTQEDGRFEVTYQLWPDAVREFSVTLTLVFEVTDGRITVSTDTAEWTADRGVTVADFSLMPYFGAVTQNVSGAAFCVPDGSGAVVNPVDGQRPAEETDYDVYTGTVIAPVYGVTVGSSAFANVTVKGDSALTVVCDTSGEFKTVYNKYILAEINREGPAAVKSYSGEICAVYSFIGSDGINFTDVASAARSVFLEYGMLTDTADDKSHTCVLLRCTDEDGNVISDTGSAQALLGLLKGKGIENIDLVLEGFLKDGSSGTEAKIVSDAGGKDGLESLSAYATSGGAKVYAAAFLRTSQKKSSVLKNSSDVRAAFTAGESSQTRYFLKTQAVKNNVTDLTDAALAFDGYYISDASADFFPARNYSSQSAGDMSGAFSSAAAGLSDSYGVITAGGYFNSAYGATLLAGVPAEPSVTPEGGRTDDPFVLAILHGCTEYTTAAVNSAEIPRLSMLKAIEYGASACVEWSCTDGQQDYYETTLSDCTDFMAETGNELADLTGAAITDHYQVSDGVFCTEYDGRTLVYVNYNNKSAVIGDITVPPYDFLRLN